MQGDGRNSSEIIQAAFAPNRAVRLGGAMCVPPGREVRKYGNSGVACGKLAAWQLNEQKPTKHDAKRIV